MFWTNNVILRKVLFLSTENEVVTLANEAVLSIENKKPTLCKNNIEHKHYYKYSDKNEFFKRTYFFEISTIYAAICRQNPYRSCKKVTDHPL